MARSPEYRREKLFESIQVVGVKWGFKKEPWWGNNRLDWKVEEEIITLIISDKKLVVLKAGGASDGPSATNG